MGLETPGTQKFGIQVENYFCSLNKLVNRLTTKNGYENLATLFFLAFIQTQHIGCSDEEYESNPSEQGEVSEFSSTPNTSVESTPDQTPEKSVSTKQKQTIRKGKDLTLLMEPGISYETPAQSLYFREMA